MKTPDDATRRGECGSSVSSPLHFYRVLCLEQSTDETILFRWFSPTVRRYLSCTERPMKIEIVVDPTKPAPAASLASRVAPAPTVTATTEAAPRFAHAYRTSCIN